MGDYAKLAVFIAVLLLSVSLMSVAIDYLGDISDIELDMEPQDEETESVASEGEESGKGKGKTVKASGVPGGELRPLFEIRYPPKTRYLRRLVGEVYEDGGWEQYADHVPLPYDYAVEIPLRVTAARARPEVGFISIRPFFNLSGFIPEVLYVVMTEFDGALERYPSLELFSAPEPSSTPYNVTFASYEFSEGMLREAEIRDMEEYLAVPGDLEDRLRALASQIVEDLPTPWERLKAIETHLKESYEYDEDYTPEPPGTNPVDWFLFNETRGTCSLFNSAFVLLARSVGLPARIVTGYLVSPDSDYQIVMPKQSHMWAEAPFTELSWVTFDATPVRPEDVEIDAIPTVTNITYNDERAIKGGNFTVQGTVTMFNGSAVDGLTVEIILTVRKNETGLIVGTGTVDEGVFEITADADPSLEVGDYQLVAHALPKGLYQESWSDPPIKIMAETEVSLDVPTSVYVGERFTVVGRLVDKSNGEPISNALVSMLVKNDTRYYTTDESGAVSFSYAYDTEGNKTLSISRGNSTYYIGSNSSFGVAVTLRPPPQPGLLQMLTMYPYNVMLAAAALVSIGAVVLLQRRRRKPTVQRAVVEARREVEVREEELPRYFEDYKDGIVKLFNWFYRAAQRRFDGIDDSLTPREFQGVLVGKIPSRGASALEYLVTAFEIADYSKSRPTKEMYDKCLAAVELLNEMMGHG